MASTQEILIEEEPLEFFLTCYYCGKTIKSKKIVSNNLPLILRDRGDSLWRGNRIIDITVCPNCSKKLPNCSICKCPIEINNSNINFRTNYNRSYSNLKDSNANENNENEQKFCYIWCIKCKHGGHVEHYLEWFNDYNICPSFECNCKCNDEIEN